MRRILLFIISFLAVLSAQAGNVTKSAALQKAQQFMQGKSFTAVLTQGTTRGDASDGSQYYYIFNADADGGFVIVSGDDRTTPILGYSDKGHIDLNRMPDNMKAWLAGYVEQLKSLTDDYQPEPRTRAGSMAAISPLIKTQWNQGAPYNNNCPMLGSTRTVTGCVATAIAQVMYYWQHPTSAIPSIPAYTTKTKGISLPELPSTSFDWGTMKLRYNGDETDESATAIAKLMQYVGQSIEMDYNIAENGGSGANVQLDVMHNIYGYSINAHYEHRSSYTTNNWEALIYSELSAQRPVLYSGGSRQIGENDNGEIVIQSTGHQFVCDGYDGNGLFHFNWGWGGYQDGYFVLSLANPSDLGIGGGAPGGYKFGQTAIIGFKPGSVGEVEIPILDGYMNEPDQTSYTRESADKDFDNVALNGYVWIFFNGTSRHVTADIGFGLYKDGELVKVLASENKTTSTEGDGEFTWNNHTATFGASLNGRYSICPIYRFSETDNWKLCNAYGPCGYIADITATSLSLRKASGSAEYTVDKVELATSMEKGSETSMTVTITNTGDAPQEALFLWMKSGDKWIPAGTNNASIEPGKSGSVIIAFTPLVAGTIDFKITSDDEGTVEKYSGQMTVADVIETTVGNWKYKFNTATKVATLIGLVNKEAETGDVTIPATITYNEVSYTLKTIGKNAFWNAYKMSSLTIAEGVETIGDAAFRYCFGLTKLELPSTLTSIGKYAFGNLTRLGSIVSHITNPVAIGEDVFGIVNDDGTTTKSPATLFVPIGSKAKYQSTAGWNKFASIYEGELKVAIVDNLRYSYVTGDKVATVLPLTDDNSERYEGDWLNNLTIPASVSIDGSTYRVVAIADNAFWNRNDIRNLVISRGIETIGQYAFRYCFGMRTLELPASLTKIADYAFGNLTRLNTVTSHIATPFAISTTVFSIVDGDAVESPSATLNVPSGSKAKYVALEGWNIFSTITEVASSETKSISISEAGQATLYSDKDLDFTDVAGMKAYTVIGNNRTTGTVWLSRVKKVPAGTPLLLRASQNSYSIPVTDIAAESYYKNMLKGTYEQISIPRTDGAYTNYYLGRDQVDRTKIGFYGVAEGGTQTIKPNQAYLQLPTTVTPVGTAGSSVQLKIGSAGQMTYFGDNSLDFNSVADKNVKAFVVTGYDKGTGTIWLSRVYEVPAGTGILVRGPEGTYSVPTVSSASVFENMLTGTLTEITAPEQGGGFTNYYLGRGTDAARTVGFYRVQGSQTIKANQAYLQIPSFMTRSGEESVEPDSYKLVFDEDPDAIISMKVYSLGGTDGETTGIERMISDEVISDKWFDLQGRKIDRPAKAGLYIRDGKKVVVR